MCDHIIFPDAEHFRKVILWLENQKIRHYKIDDRKELRDITSTEWPKTFEKYCNDVQCPVTKNMVDQLEWFIGYAIWLEFEDDSKYGFVIFFFKNKKSQYKHL